MEKGREWSVIMKECAIETALSPDIHLAKICRSRYIDSSLSLSLSHLQINQIKQNVFPPLGAPPPPPAGAASWDFARPTDLSRP